MIWFLAAILQCVVLFGLWRHSRNTILSKDAVHNLAPLEAGTTYPTVGIIIPATGDNPSMQEALSSLLEQDYPNILPVIVTASEQDPATRLANSLKDKFPHLDCIIAGQAQTCSQKNHNILQGLNHVGARADIYVFCDSTHIAKPNFVRALVWPIVKSEAGFCTGYHDVEAVDDHVVSLAYQFSVLLMRLLQAIVTLAQPWGGAMAVSRAMFEEHKIADTWKENVVDDCSLAAIMLKKRIHVRLCPQAMLTTKAKNHSLPTWQAWMQRQVLFLKFCVISQWYLLGFFAIFLTLPVLFSCFTILGGLTGTLSTDSAWFVILSLAHLGILSKIILNWREMLPRPTPAKNWLMGFFLGIFMFTWVYIKTIRAWHIDWHGFRYHVAKNGKLLRMEKI